METRRQKSYVYNVLEKNNHFKTRILWYKQPWKWMQNDIFKWTIFNVLLYNKRISYYQAILRKILKNIF